VLVTRDNNGKGMEGKVMNLRYKESGELSSKFKSEILNPTRNSRSITTYAEFEVQDEKNRTMATSEPSSMRLYKSKFPDFVICSPSISFIMPPSSGRLILRPNPGFLSLSFFCPMLQELKDKWVKLSQTRTWNN
jgi:hypothetical protein